MDRWSWVYEAAGSLGWPVPTVLACTLPELLLALRGYQRAQGIDPDETPDEAMTRAALNDLIERYE